MSRVSDFCDAAEHFMAAGEPPDAAYDLAKRRVSGAEIKGMAAAVRRLASDLQMMSVDMEQKGMAYADKALLAAVRCRFVISEIFP